MAAISALTRIAPSLPASRLAGRGVPDRERPIPVDTLADRVAVRAAEPARGALASKAGVPLYGVAAYLGVARALADRPAPDARLELSARVLADGERVSVARRLEAGRTVGIEAVVG